MPCRNDYPEPTHEELRRDWEAQLRHDSELADMLCAVLRTAEENGIDDTQFIDHIFQYMSSANRIKIQKWWKEHKIRDEEKAKSDAIRQKDLKRKALAKLTDEEKKVLGV